MGSAIHDIPELQAWRRGGGLVRIPPDDDVPLTPRVRRLIDTRAFRRLSQISQLGLVSLVYPAANHSRQEHSLGVYLAAIEYLARLGADDRFGGAISPRQAELFLVAALLHDVGHFPFGHPIEDIGLEGVPPHELLARRQITGDEIHELLENDWNLDAAEVAALVGDETETIAGRILGSMLSGPIDVDKIDYLMRDSLHAGVPYGRHFDRRRLIGSLSLNEAGDGLAITEKGRTAAEMMVFARYVMFSEVYWHHAVRSATAMFQRAFFETARALELESWIDLTDRPMIDALRKASAPPARALLEAIFGERRQLYKRLAEFNYFEEPAMYERLAHRPFADLVRIGARISDELTRALGERVEAHEVLVDAPPAKLEVDFNVEVYYPKRGMYRRLDDVSPVVRTLARDQFDNHVKRVRIFVHPRIAESAARSRGLAERISEIAAV